MIPRILNLVQRDAPEQEVAAKVLQANYLSVHSWIWLPWVSQLLSGLLRPDAVVYKDILLYLATNHPQVRVIFFIRVFQC